MNGLELRRYERNTDRLIVAILTFAVTAGSGILIYGYEMLSCAQ